MSNILVLGAGRSSGKLIEYLYEKSQKYQWKMTVVDSNEQFLKDKCLDKPEINTSVLDINDPDQRRAFIGSNDIVISLLPASFHHLPAKDCLELGKHFINASYVNDELSVIYKEGISRGLIFMGELGLDPGLDHLSAEKMLDHLRDNGKEIASFRSFAGGLVAPESDDNPWNYKFSWNPKNVVLAGRGVAQFRANGRSYFTPYNQLFGRSYQITIPGSGDFDWYPNRDSMLYIPRYKLYDCPTVIRGTLRMPGFCRAWNALIKLGLTDDNSVLSNMDEISFSEWIRGIIKCSKQEDLVTHLAQFLGIEPNDKIIDQLKYIDLLSDKKIKSNRSTAAGILESLLKEKWALKEQDKDRIVMMHEIIYKEDDGQYFEYTSILDKEGVNKEQTAMSELVGLPLAVMAEKILTGEINKTIRTIPIERKVYGPILTQLEELNVKFQEQIKPL